MGYWFRAVAEARAIALSRRYNCSYYLVKEAKGYNATSRLKPHQVALALFEKGEQIATFGGNMKYEYKSVITVDVGHGPEEFGDIEEAIDYVVEELQTSKDEEESKKEDLQEQKKISKNLSVLLKELEDVRQKINASLIPE